MSSDFEMLSRRLADAIKYTNQKGTQGYDTSAEVVRVKDGIAYVHIEGGVDETPVALTINAKEGDIVQLRVSGGSAWMVGNHSSPPTDDSTALTAKEMAKSATKSAITAGKAAVEALDSSRVAKEAAQQAISDAADAAQAASNAMDAANTAQASADAAQSSADAAQASADSAQQEATYAKTSAEAAATQAASALSSAQSATRSANSALTQLSVVEDVVNVLSWISEHASYKASADTEVVQGKYYFTKSGDTYNLVANPTGNPSTQGYYEIDSIDESVTNYISTHLSLTNAGLWVIGGSTDYKILLAADGMKVYDKDGNLVATFGESITFSSDRPQYIGGEDAYIIFYDSDNDNVPDSINIGGNNLMLGNTAHLSEVIDSIATARSASDQAKQNAMDISNQNSKYDALYNEIRIAVSDLTNSTSIFKGDALEDYQSDEVPTLLNYPTFTDFFIWDKCSTSLYCSRQLICGTNDYAAHTDEILLYTTYNDLYQFRYDSTEQSYSWERMTAAEVEALSNSYSYISVDNDCITIKSSKNNQSAELLIEPTGITPSLIYCC